MAEDQAIPRGNETANAAGVGGAVDVFGASGEGALEGDAVQLAGVRLAEPGRRNILSAALLDGGHAFQVVGTARGDGHVARPSGEGARVLGEGCAALAVIDVLERGPAGTVLETTGGADDIVLEHATELVTLVADRLDDFGGHLPVAPVEVGRFTQPRFEGGGGAAAFVPAPPQEGDAVAHLDEVETIVEAQTVQMDHSGQVSDIGAESKRRDGEGLRLGPLLADEVLGGGALEAAGAVPG